MPKRRKLIKAVDLFAGAGGASNGLVYACRQLGYDLDLLAINHWPIAVETHGINHPNVVHLCEAVDRVDPVSRQFVDPLSHRVFRNTGRFDVLLAGPECTHFSTARGGRPVNPQSRASAWSILKWAQELYIDTIIIENVPEFRSWGPVGANGRPLKSKAGQTYHAFLEALRSLGYRVDDKILNAADYGDATTRRRLFIFARRGHGPLAWPVATHSRHGDSTLFNTCHRWATAREKVIDWAVKGKNIFERDKPLRPATMLRIIAGLEKFGGVQLRPFLYKLRENCTRAYLKEIILGFAPLIQLLLDMPIAAALCFAFLCRAARIAAMFLPDEGLERSRGSVLEPFLIVLRRNGKAVSINQPVSTLTGNGKHHALVDATLVAMEHGGREVNADSPLPTITAAKGGAFGVAEACLVHTTHGGRENDVDAPVPTVTGAHRGEMGLAQAYLLGQQSGSVLRPDDEPVPTVAAGGAISVVQPFLTSAGGPERQGNIPTSVDQPVPTLLTKNHKALVEAEIRPADDAFLIDASFGESRGGVEARVRSTNEPLGVLPGSNRYGLAEAALVPLYSEREDQDPRSHSVDEPVPTIPGTGGGKFGVAESFIVPQRRFDDDVPRVDSVDAPLRTITGTGGRCFGLAEPFVVKTSNKGANGEYVYSADDPISTITSRQEHALVEPFISPQRSNAAPHSTSEPIPSLTCSEHMALIEPFIFANNTNNVAQSVDGPVPTVTGANRLNLVESHIATPGKKRRRGRRRKTEHVRLEAPVIDGKVLVILFRMLQIRELARAMSFPEHYEFAGTQEHVVKQIGNAWPGELSKALSVAALTKEKKQKTREEMVV